MNIGLKVVKHLLEGDQILKNLAANNSSPS